MKEPKDKIVNYIQLKGKFDFFRHTFAYLDTEDYLADRIFERKCIKVKFVNMEGRRGPWTIVFCRVKKKEVPEFINSMNELARNITLLSDDQTYKEICDHLFAKFLVNNV